MAEHVVKPKDLSIVWSKDSRYWRMPPASQEDEPAELLQVCWLEVTGKHEAAESQSRYRVEFEVSLTSDAFGWTGTPIYVLAKRGKRGRYTFKRENLAGRRPNEKFMVPSLPLEVGPATDSSDAGIHFGLYEVWSGMWKGGLKIHRAIVTKL